MSAELVVSAATSLMRFVSDAVKKPLESVRTARAVWALLFSGTSLSRPLRDQITEYLIGTQREDGGWSDPEETAWSSGAISSLGEQSEPIQAAAKWLNSVRRPTGGWGRHNRDQARIPITALIATLLPDVVKLDDITWISNEWQRDFEGPVRLSYKAGFVLLAVPAGYGKAFVVQTVEHLAKDQNEDGGFGPWRNHPMGSDPWSTGVVLWGLSRWITLVDKTVIHGAISWLERNQLPSGYWPYHYLDDGTSLALIGAVSAMKAMASVE
jgi:hypothetical protein